MNKKYWVALTISGMLSACGGGGSDSPAAAVPAAAAPVAPVVAVTPPVIAAELVDMPAVIASTTISSTGTVNQGGSGSVWNVTTTGMVKLNVTGNNNKTWMLATQAGGTAVVNGDNNTIIFRPGTDATVNVTGKANTFYMVQGSPIKIEGTGAGASTVIYYKPV